MGFPQIRYASYLTPISRELAIDAGILEPTPAEREELDRQAAVYERRAAERAARLDAARGRLAELTDPLARAVLDLHAEDERGECEGCEFSGYEAERPKWPCSTVGVVAERYGIRFA